MNTIPVFRPLIEEEEISAAVESLRLGWLGMGSYVKEFEDAITELCDFSPDSARRVVAVSTGHAALHLSMLMADVGPGDEVITPAFNNAADLQAIRACGAEPVFVDIGRNTLCVDVNKIEELITEKTKCIIAMDYDIYLCDHDALVEISMRRDVPILHDAAHSFGSKYKGRPIGNQHQYTMFSFDPVKTVTCIDGGAIILEGNREAERLQAKRLIGMTQPAKEMYTNNRAWTYDIEELGYRYHLANLHAAIGVEQIKKLSDIRASRFEVCNAYARGLSDLNWLYAPSIESSDINPFLYYVLVLNGRRNELREHMRENGVDTGIHWQAGNTFEFFKNCRRGPLTVTEEVAEQVLSLPLHSKMDPDDVSHVVSSLWAFK